MRRRWFPSLLSVTLGLLLLPSAALAANTGWGDRNRTAKNPSNRTNRQKVWGHPNRPQNNRVGWGNPNNGGNPNYRQEGIGPTVTGTTGAIATMTGGTTDASIPTMTEIATSSGIATATTVGMTMTTMTTMAAGAMDAGTAAPRPAGSTAER